MEYYSNDVMHSMYSMPIYLEPRRIKLPIVLQTLSNAPNQLLISNTGILCANFYSKNLFVSVRFCNLYNNTFSNYKEHLIFNRQVSSSILNNQFGKK